MLRILFVYRVFPPKNEDPIVDEQAKSLINHGKLDIKFLKINKPKIGYLIAAVKLFFLSIINRYDIIHFHHSYSGYLSIFSFKGKKVCSLMGSDILEEKGFYKKLTNIYINKMWDGIIVKSKEMQKLVPKSKVIPNGVNFNDFRPIDRSTAYDKTSYNSDLFNIIFVSTDLDDRVKNFQLALESLKKIKIESITLKTITNVNHSELIYYYNAADMLLLTSLSEGSPNVVKEALACNCPVVSTNVGDVNELISKVDNCYVTSWDSDDVVDKIMKVYNNKNRSNGREKISRLKHQNIADKIVNFYLSITNINL